MRHFLHNQLPRLSRAVAWPLAALLLWMGTGGVLHHTDAAQDPASSSPRAAWGHATPPAPADDGCAACQWTQSVQSGALGVCPLVLPGGLVAPRACRVPDRLLSRTPRLRSPRAPPVFLS